MIGGPTLIFTGWTFYSADWILTFGLQKPFFYVHYAIGHYEEEIALVELCSQIYSLWSQKSLTPKHSTHWPIVIIIIYGHIILKSEIRSNIAKGYFMVNQRSFF